MLILPNLSFISQFSKIPVPHSDSNGIEMLQQSLGVFAARTKNVTHFCQSDLSLLLDRLSNLCHHRIIILFAENDVVRYQDQFIQLNKRIDDLLTGFQITFLYGRWTIWILFEFPQQHPDFCLLPAIEFYFVPCEGYRSP